MTTTRRKRRKSPARGVHWSAAQGSYVFDRILRRLTPPRLVVKLQTDDADEAAWRAQAIMAVYHRGQYGALALLRARKLLIGDFASAVRAGDYDRLVTAHDQSVSLDSATDELLDSMRASGNRARKTLVIAEDVMRQFRAHFGERDILTLSATEMREWLAAVKATTGKPWSNSRRAQAYLHVRKAWHIAHKRVEDEARRLGVPPPKLVDPWTDIEQPRVKLGSADYLTVEEYHALRRKNEGLPRLLLVALGFLAGLRIEEAGRLRTRLDVDLERRLLHIRPHAGKRAWRPKRERSIRVVDICDELLGLIETHIASGFAGEYLICSARAKDRPLHETSLIRWTEEAFNAAGIVYGRKREGGRTHHSCRHGFATHLLTHGAPVPAVAQAMGDRDETVLRVYSHAIPGSRTEAVMRMDAIVRNGGPNGSQEGI